MKVFVTLVINVDYDQSETSWEIKDIDENNVIQRLEPGTYNERCKQYNHTIELTYDRPYTFTIKDTFGDGMSKVCEANYSIIVTTTGETLFNGDGFSFTSSTSHTFTIDTPSQELLSNSPTLVPSNIQPKPSVYPSFLRKTSRPSYIPSIVPSLSPSIYIDKERPFTLILKFDSKPNDIAWKIATQSQYTSEVLYGASFDHYNTPCGYVKLQLYLIEDMPYELTIYDRQGNGMLETCSNDGKDETKPHFSLYEGTMDNLTNLILRGDGNSFTSVHQQSFYVQKLNRSISKVPTLEPSLYVDIERDIDAVPSIFESQILIPALTISGMAIAGCLAFVLGFIVFKMFSMRQKGKHIPSETQF